MAGRSIDAAGLIRHGSWPIRAKVGAARCRLILCPVCGSARMLRYRDTVTERLLRAERQGLGLAFHTVTLPSLPLGRVSEQIAALRRLLEKAKSGAPYRRIARLYGVDGHLSVVQVTLRSAGWHAHVHLVVAARDMPGAALASLAITDRYRRYAARAGCQVAPEMTDEQPVHEPAGLARYLTARVRRVGGAAFVARLRRREGRVRDDRQDRPSRRQAPRDPLRPSLP